MSSQKVNKLNQLVTNWPAETVAVYEWLKTQGMYRQLIDRYVQSGWLKRIGKGAFFRLGEQVDWTGGLYALQKYKKLNIHAAGITALQLQGYAHYVPLGSYSNVYLLGSTGTKLPKWFDEYSWKRRIKFKTSALFGKSCKYALISITRKKYEITVSSPERAMLELLQAIPAEESFEHAKNIMEGLTTLRPDITQNLLEMCRSVKVKRLFLFIAEQCNHAWFKKIDTKKVDLGKGKRMIVENGRLDPKYLITVPTDFTRNETINI
ncbi:type IV toxin-antitoxin system AbiEi family antitoxin [bacterium]|nr:type IV toxin-antitoxin system AbiEi family antitoxin [bacterium]